MFKNTMVKTCQLFPICKMKEIIVLPLDISAEIKYNENRKGSSPDGCAPIGFK